MLDKDLADSPLASCDPELPEEGPADLIVEELLAVHSRLQTSDRRTFCAVAMSAVKRGLDQAGDADSSSSQQIVTFFRAMERDDNRKVALYATCYLRLLNIEGRSFDEIAKEHGVVRATVNLVFRRLQESLALRGVALRSRGDKSAESREACRKRRVGVRKVRSNWNRSTLWNNHQPAPAN